MSVKTRRFVVIVAALGLVQLASSALNWPHFDGSRFPWYFLAVAVSSFFELKRPGLNQSFSFSLPLVLLSIVQLSGEEAVVIGCASVLIQSLTKPELRANPFRILVAVAIQATVVATASFALAAVLPRAFDGAVVRVLVGAVTLFVANTLPVAVAVRLSEQERLGKIWKDSYFWSFPYYLVSGGLALVIDSRHSISLETALLAVISLFLAYRYYKTQRAELETQRKHAVQMAALHLRAIEGLALAVEAKDNLNTRGHLRRVQVYSLGIGREMGLDETALEALHAGALLHDIGKLAVPEHILTKPGKLTPEEFAKMKVHPVVGAEIVEQVNFPYPVAPIVRSHHEKWDGSGYPLGLAGEEIPIGARILTAVDCLDALTSDREYRKGIPLDEAMQYIIGESGKSFDPKVVCVLERMYRTLDQQASVDPGTERTLSTSAVIERGAAPDAGLDLCTSAQRDSDGFKFLSSIAAARREDTMLRTMAANATGLDLLQTLPRIDDVLKRMLAYDAMAFFVRRANALRVEYASGLNQEALSELEIDLGAGLTGWVGQNRQPVVNGNPSVDPGFWTEPAHPLNAALAIPLEGDQGLVGVLTLYRREKDSFTRDELRILNAVTPNMATVIGNALTYRETRLLANVDSVTGLPNAAAFQHLLGEELSRGRRTHGSLTLLLVSVREYSLLVDGRGDAWTGELMAKFANAIKRTCRGYDRVARIDDDTFALALPAMKADYLPVKFAGIEKLASAEAEAAGETVTLSFGGAFYPEDGDSPRALLALARRRSKNANSQWASSIRALAESVTTPGPAVDANTPRNDRRQSGERQTTGRPG